MLTIRKSKNSWISTGVLLSLKPKSSLKQSMLTQAESGFLFLREAYDSSRDLITHQSQGAGLNSNCSTGQQKEKLSEPIGFVTGHLDVRYLNTNNHQIIHYGTKKKPGTNEI